MLFLLIMILFFVILTSCTPSFIFGFPQKDYNKKSLLLANDNVVGKISNYINIKGYYCVTPTMMPKSFNNYIYKATRQGIIFFDDGSYSFLNWKDDPPIYLNIPDVNLGSYMCEYDYRINTGLSTQTLKLRHFDLCGGLYKVIGDTIYMEEISADYVSNIIRKYNFKIIDNTSIYLVGYEIMTKTDTIQIIDGIPQCYKSLHFIPAHNLPSSVNMYNKFMKDRWLDKRNRKRYKQIRRDYLKNK